MKRSLILMALLAALALAASAVACGDGDDADEKAVEDTVRSAFTQDPAKGAEAFLALITDKGLSELTGVPLEEIEAVKEEIRGSSGEEEEPFVIRALSNTKVSGNTATTELEQGDPTTVRIDRVTLIKDAGAWKIDGYENYAVSPQIPDGYKVVDLKTQEFAFIFDADQVSTGKIAFKVENIGKQDHEVPLAKVPEDFDFEEELRRFASGEPASEDLEAFGRIAIKAGTSTNMVLLKPLEPGRYIMACVFPDTDDPERKPHFLKGMTADFTVR